MVGKPSRPVIGDACKSGMARDEVGLAKASTAIIGSSKSAAELMRASLSKMPDFFS
jgi:hypothetical protein